MSNILTTILSTKPSTLTETPVMGSARAEKCSALSSVLDKTATLADDELSYSSLELEPPVALSDERLKDIYNLIFKGHIKDPETMFLLNTNKSLLKNEDYFDCFHWSLGFKKIVKKHVPPYISDVVLLYNSYGYKLISPSSFDGNQQYLNYCKKHAKIGLYISKCNIVSHAQVRIEVPVSQTETKLMWTSKLGADYPYIVATPSFLYLLNFYNHLRPRGNRLTKTAFFEKTLATE